MPPRAELKLVAKYGIEPSSIGYQPIALPLSYIAIIQQDRLFSQFERLSFLVC
jgi:hypothetical protein